MSCLDAVLGEVARTVERELRPRLGGLFGGMIRAYLPQIWEFRTEQGVHYLSVDRDGSVRTLAAAAPPPDVTIAAPHDGLRDALQHRRPGALAPGAVTVTGHTAKGRAALQLLRGRLGL